MRFFTESLGSKITSPYPSVPLLDPSSPFSLSLYQENRPIKLKKDHIKTRKRRCRGSEDLEQATAAGHLTSSYTAMPHYPTAQGYVMMAAGVEPQRDQHSPLSDGSVTMVTTSAAPTSTQSSVY